MTDELEAIGRKIAALDMWDAIAPYNWAIKPRGVAFPYFCTLAGRQAARTDFMLLEGWQTFHDYIRTRIDANFGFYTSCQEFAQFTLETGAAGVRVRRRDPGYVERDVTDAEARLCAKILWEAYGVMLRIESEKDLAMKYAAENAIFSRVEGADGVWRDEPLAVPVPRPHVEHLSFPKKDIAAAKDLPFATEEAIAVDFRFVPQLMSNEPRPRAAYMLVIVNAKTGEKLLALRLAINPESGLRGLWEAMPARFLKALLASGRIPGEIQVGSLRMFRMLSPLCRELPFKLSLHDKLEHMDAQFMV